MSKGSLSLGDSNLPYTSIWRNLKCWGVSKEPWVFQEMAHLKPDAEIKKKLSGKCWATWLNKEIGFWNTLCWDPLSTNKKHELFFLTVPQLLLQCSPGFTNILPWFQIWGVCSLSTWHAIHLNLLHKDLFIQGRSSYILIIGSSLAMISLSLSLSLPLLYY